MYKNKFNAIVAGRKRKKGGQGGGSNGNNVKCFSEEDLINCKSIKDL